MCNFRRIVEGTVKPAVSKSKPWAWNTSYKIIWKLSVCTVQTQKALTGNIILKKQTIPSITTIVPWFKVCFNITAHYYSSVFKIVLTHFLAACKKNNNKKLLNRFSNLAVTHTERVTTHRVSLFNSTFISFFSNPERKPTWTLMTDDCKKFKKEKRNTHTHTRLHTHTHRKCYNPQCIIIIWDVVQSKSSSSLLLTFSCAQWSWASYIFFYTDTNLKDIN